LKTKPYSRFALKADGDVRGPSIWRSFLYPTDF
jgi:hypothetical protein